MKKRQLKKYQKIERVSEALRKLADEADKWAADLQTSMTRISWLIRENTSLISRFPIKVEDFLTNPPIHNGNYLIYFVRKDSVVVRFYTFVAGKWFDSQKNEVNMKGLYPSCYLVAPVLAADAIDVYRRRAR